jgi:glycosyltransferase involved in cell wall biosynthesis
VPEVCFETRPTLLASRLDVALRQGFRPARTALDPEQNKRAWVAWHEEQGVASLPSIRSVTPTTWPKVSLCMTTFNRPTLLAQALESVKAIAYPNLEVVLTDDGSTRPEAIAYLDGLEADFAVRGWKIMRQENKYLGAARNTGARHASGDFLLFMDDDNYAEPQEVTTLVHAMLNSGADIISCGMYYFQGLAEPAAKSNAKRSGWLPLGGAVSAGAFANCFGDANALVRRACFEGVGGFTEDYGVTHEDWEFHARAVLKGYKLQAVPEFLFWYRVNEDSMIRTLASYPNHQRSIRPYLEAVSPELRNLVLYAKGLTLQHAEIGGSPALAAYTKATILWRSKVEAGRELAALGRPQDAARLMLAGIKTVESCKIPKVILEALLGTCEHLAALDVGRTRFLLGLAINLSESMQRPKDKETAQAMLAALDQRKPAAGGKSERLALAS